MASKSSIAISYWAYPLEGGKMEDFVGIDEFEAELSENFNVFVGGKATDAMGGGLYELTMVILHNDTVQNTLLYGAGIASDMVKDEAKGWLVKHIGQPIKQAFAKLKDANKEKTPEIDRLELHFKDIYFIIYNICPDGIAKNLDIILDVFEARINEFNSNGQLPNYINVPVYLDEQVESSDWKKLPVYRRLENVDETIQAKGIEDYLNYWGLFYTFQEQRCKVYNVRTREI